MPQFRFLTDEELSHLEEEFKQFLIVNSIYHDEWLKMNQDGPEKALEIVGLFSDTVFKRIYQNVRYLEQYAEHSFFSFKFDGDRAQLFAVKSEDNISSPELLKKQMESNSNKLEFFKSERTFQGDALFEIHRLIEQGALISDGFMWTKLAEFIA